MTLSEAIRQRQALRAVRENRDRNEAAGKRVDEIVAVTEVESDYTKADRSGDLEMESWFSTAYQSMPTDDLRDLIARGFVIWQRTERREEGTVAESVSDAADLLRANNPFWLGDESVTEA